jgi:hypothetical protein
MRHDKREFILWAPETRPAPCHRSFGVVDLAQVVRGGRLGHLASASGTPCGTTTAREKPNVVVVLILTPSACDGGVANVTITVGLASRDREVDRFDIRARTFYGFIQAESKSTAHLTLFARPRCALAQVARSHREEDPAHAREHPDQARLSTIDPPDS